MFNIGDRVIATFNYDGRQIVGKSGVIIAREERGHRRCGVKFDNHIGGHALGGRCTDGYGWWVPDRYLDIEPDMSVPAPSFEELF